MTGERVLIVAASMGSGHVEVARELARRLDAAGATSKVVDMLGLAGPAGRRLQRTYRLLLGHAAWLYDASMRFWERFPAAMQALTAAGAGPFERSLAAEATRFRPDVVVSTYNLASQCLGRLARRGRMAAPVITYVIDPGAHPYWVSDGVRLHLAALPVTAAHLARLGATRIGLSPPLLRPEFVDPPGRTEARCRLGLPADARIVLVSAGSWAAGDVAATVDEVRRVDGILPVVLCGRDEAFRRRTARLDGVRAVTWTADMAGYLAAADVVVDNAGGQTCWEALSCGVPVVLFRPLPGHGRINAGVLNAAGLAFWAHDARTLADALSASRRMPTSPLRFAGYDAAQQVLAVAAGA